MNNQEDSLDKFFDDLPKYTMEDFLKLIPYERALALCKNRESMEECLKQIAIEAFNLQIPQEIFDNDCRKYYNEFLLSIGESLPDPDYDDIPEDVVEILKLEAKIQRLEKGRKTQESETDPEESAIDENSEVYFSFGNSTKLFYIDEILPNIMKSLILVQNMPYSY